MIYELRTRDPAALPYPQTLTAQFGQTIIENADERPRVPDLAGIPVLPLRGLWPIPPAVRAGTSGRCAAIAERGFAGNRLGLAARVRAVK